MLKYYLMAKNKYYLRHISKLILIEKLISINKQKLLLENNIMILNNYIIKLRDNIIELEYKPNGLIYENIKKHYESLLNYKYISNIINY